MTTPNYPLIRYSFKQGIDIDWLYNALVYTVLLFVRCVMGSCIPIMLFFKEKQQLNDRRQHRLIIHPIKHRRIQVNMVLKLNKNRQSRYLTRDYDVNCKLHTQHESVNWCYIGKCWNNLFIQTVPSF